MTIAESVNRQKGGHRISRGWFKHYKKRLPQFSVSRRHKTANVCMGSVTPEVISQYFDQLKDVLEVYGLKTEPEKIYNVTRRDCLKRGHKKV